VASMFDATYPAGIPDSAGIPDYAMGYVDGEWPSYDGMVAKYPSAHPVAISAIPGSPTAGRAQGCDGEKGDYDPAQAAHFAAFKLVLGVVPFIYCSWAAWHDYQVACTAVGIQPTEVDWGIAAYPGIGPVPYPGSVFHQYVDHGPYDESVVVDGWVPGRPTATAPTTPTGDPMPCSPAVTFKPQQTDVFQIAFGVLWHKWGRPGGWSNEALTGPFSVVAPTRVLKLADQEPMVAVLGSQCNVTFEDAAGRVWLLAQDATSNQWGVVELP